ncbi:Actin-related_protein [Hexamita inflata]|uniref:Actin-related protein n=1 Tax=Hexamita inflata TaxID=28002 RepID=A0AA86P6F7_9EUKA|nr:Actin-related protein [Hexamita inflata]
MTTILDLGSHTFKFGQARLSNPWIIPQQALSLTSTPHNSFFSDEVNNFSDYNPAVQGGQIANFDQLERLLKMVQLASSTKVDTKVSEYINDLTKQCVQSNRCAQVIVEPENVLSNQLDGDSDPLQKLFLVTPHNEESKKQLAQICFEKMQIKQLGFADQSVLSLFSTGNVSGISVSLGHGCTHVNVVQDGYWLSSQTQQLIRVSTGETCLKTLQKFLYQQNIVLGNDVESRHVLNIIKNQLQVDYKKDQRFQLPDGSSITVQGHILQKLSKVYTDPANLGFSEQPLPYILDTMMQQIPPANLKQLKVCHLSGGMANSKQLTGYIARKWFADNIKMTCNQVNPQNDAYIGAQAVVMSQPDSEFITKKMYDEQGDQVWSTKRKE